MQTETYIHLGQLPAFFAEIEHFICDAKVYDSDDTQSDENRRQIDKFCINFHDW